MAKILVIEDEDSVRANIVERLEAEDFSAIGAENGFVGVTWARQYRPDLIICDVMMPEMDGYEVLTALRQEPVTATVPFIFLTAKADKVDLRQGMELGADDYLTKPFTKTELLGAIAARLNKQSAVNQESEQKLEDFRRSIIEAMPKEVLSPLYEIRSYSQMLADNYNLVAPNEILETAQNISNSALLLNRLIENFLIYAQIELLAKNPEEIKALSKCYTLNPEEIIAQLVTQRAQEVHREADLILEIVNTTVRIGEQDLRKVVEELIDNALKFSQAGTPIYVEAVVENGVFILQITNQGEQMKAEQIDNIGACIQFNHKFYQQKGLGMGLIISKRIAEVHGGQLTIHSGNNSRTTVCVRLQTTESVSYPV